MFCYVEQRKFSDLFLSIDTEAIERRLPYMGALELTYRCNQACLHCYCNLGEGDKRQVDELSTQEIKRILDEAAAAGCLWLLLTGGEVLLRSDFWDIYIHAAKKGMLIEVFTNATLIDEKAASLFAEFPPLGIDISFYGSNPALHDRITGVVGSFQKTMDGIGWLKKHGVKFSLKTVLMTVNHAELKNMQVLAEGLGAEFRYDTLVSPRTDGGMSPVKYRLSAELMADLDLGEDYQDCERIFKGFWNKKPNEAISCGAGIFAFNINPYGYLSPCTMFQGFQYSLRGVLFFNAWKRLVSDYDKRQNDLVPFECRACSMLHICSNCPAWSEIEAKSMNAKVDYICEYAKCLEKKYFTLKEADYGKKTLSKARD